MRSMTREEWKGFVNALIADSDLEVIGTMAKGPRFQYGPLEDAEELRLDHDVTILPPKKYFLPTHEELLSYSLTDKFDYKPTRDAKKRVIIGMHPYDMVALQQMDKVYLGPHKDDNYEERRRSTLIIASDILNVSERSFAASIGTHIVKDGFDLLVTDIGKRIIVEEGTKAGRELLKKYGTARPATKLHIEAVNKMRDELSSNYSRSVKVLKEKWGELLQSNMDNPVWEEQSKKCLTCGSCTMVCPTCYCFDVEDNIDIDMKGGNRVRTWDGCLLKDFTAVASGEVFREKVKDRYRHRFYRKGLYLPMRYGFVACVGCGRCASQCLPDIADPHDLMNTLEMYNVHNRTELPVPKVEQRPVTKDLMMPQSATLLRKVRMTELETLYELKLDSGKSLGHKPGQFVEVSLFGIGEAPISISSAPREGSFELLVRRLGDVTTKLESLNPGDKVGIRGPMGNGFDTEGMKGKDILFIAGGCGLPPLRSVIEHVMNNRKDYGKVFIIYGCKKPKSLLFQEDLKAWKARGDVTVKLAVESCDAGECWDGDVGMITMLLPPLELDPVRTIACVVGPPIMYRFVIKELKKKNIPDENIVVSLERRMKCGVGKCGHCQMNGIYVCLEGPVYNYKEVKDIPEAF